MHGVLAFDLPFVIRHRWLCSSFWFALVFLSVYLARQSWPDSLLPAPISRVYPRASSGSQSLPVSLLSNLLNLHHSTPCLALLCGYIVEREAFLLLWLDSSLPLEYSGTTQRFLCCYTRGCHRLLDDCLWSWSCRSSSALAVVPSTGPLWSSCLRTGCCNIGMSRKSSGGVQRPVDDGALVGLRSFIGQRNHLRGRTGQAGVDVGGLRRYHCWLVG